MAFMIDKVSEDTFYENIFLGVTKILEKNHRIKNVHLERHQACIASDIVMWEQINGVKLPDDLRDFYLSTNGMCLTWNYVFSQQEILPVGNINICQMSELAVLAKTNLQVAPEIKPQKNKMYAHCNSEAKAVFLSSIDENSKVCLVFGTNFRIPPSYFLIENDSICYYLTNNFKKYLLMSIAHLGLPMWQYCFTPQGVPSWVEQMIIMIAPHLDVAQPVTKTPEDELFDDKLDYHHFYNYPLNKLDTNIFKSKRRSSKNNAGDMLKYRVRHS